MNERLVQLLKHARSLHRNRRDLRIYESYKNSISRLAETPREYQQAITKLCGILKV